MGSNSMSAASISPDPQETNINYTLECLIDPYLPAGAFKKRLRSYLDGSAPGLAWEGANPTLLEPFTASIRGFFYRRISSAQPRYSGIEELLVAAEATNIALKRYKARGGPWIQITAEAVATVLGGQEQFRDHMDPGALAKMFGSMSSARQLKETLEDRIWAVEAEVKGRDMEWPEFGELLITSLMEEADCHCVNENLFVVEMENREMVMKWLGR